VAGTDDESMDDDLEDDQDRIWQEMDRQYGMRQHSINLCNRKP
jgi:hypothetical protein